MDRKNGPRKIIIFCPFFYWGQDWMGVCPHEWSLKLSKFERPHWNLPLPPGVSAGAKNAGNMVFWKSAFWRSYELWLPPLPLKLIFEKNELLVPKKRPRYYRTDIQIKSDKVIEKSEKESFTWIKNIELYYFYIILTLSVQQELFIHVYHLILLSIDAFSINSRNLPPCPRR